MKKKMKKVLSVLLCVMLMSGTFALYASAETFEYNRQKLEIQTEGEYKYVILNEASLSDEDRSFGIAADTALITKYTGTSASIVIPATLGGKSVSVVGYQSFKGNTAIQTVTIGNTVKAIHSEAFMNCTGLQQVLIANNVAKIYGNAFNNCTGLKTVTFQKGSALKTIGESAFCGCTSLNDFIIPDGVETIGSWAFYNCDSLISIIIPDSVTSFGNTVFFNCNSLRNAIIGNGITDLKSDGNYRNNWGSYNYASGTFEGCISLESITIGSAVKTIGQDCFAGTSLKNVNIPDNVITVSKGAFMNCSKLEKITIGNGVTDIGYDAFNNCDSLADVKIGSGVISIGDHAFYDCDALEYINIPSNVTSLGKAAFFHCDKLKNAVTGNGVTSLSSDDNYRSNWGSYNYASGVFEGCISLENITIGSAVKTIGQDCFAGTALTDVYIPDNVITVAPGAFMNCSKLEKLTIGNGVTSLGYQFVNNCDVLTDIKIGSGVISIGDHAFFDCDALEYINIPSNVTSLGKAAFFHCDKLETAVIGNGVTSLSSDGSYRSNWGSYNYASGVFEACINLDTVTIGNGVISIGQDTFAGTKVTDLTVPFKVSTLGNGAFAGAKELKDIYFVGNWAPTVGNDIFGNIADGYTVYHTATAVGYDGLPYNTETFTPITVTFDNNDDDVFCAPTESQIMSPNGGYVIEPITPAALGYLFAGWYKDQACTVKWDFKNDKVTSDTTLYAKWNSVDSVAPVRPENIETAAKDGNSVTLRWSAVDGAKSYNVYANNVKVNKSDITENTYKVTGLESSTTYEFVVTAVNSKGESENSLIYAERTGDHIHTFSEWTVTKEADCGNEGLKTRSCTDCDAAETEKIPVTGEHSYGEWTVIEAPDCTKEGTQKKICSVCGKTETQSVPKTDEHKFGDWKTVIEPTDDKDGETVRECSLCGKIESKVLPAIGSVMKGDIDGNGKVTVADARAALRMAARLDPTTEYALKAGDLDGNGKIEIAEARKILRVAARIDTFDSGMASDKTLTVDEIKKIYFEASQFFIKWMEPKTALPYLDSDKLKFNEGGYTKYFLRLDTSKTEYKSIDEIKDACSKYFGGEKYDELIAEIDQDYIYKDGKLYVYSEQYGYGVGDCSYEIKIISADSNTCKFSVVESGDDGLGNIVAGAPYYLTLEKVNGNWVFTNKEFQYAVVDVD